MNLTTDKINIVSFQTEYATAFKRLNEAWLEKYFSIEPADELALSNPQGYIINKGGHIFFIKVNDEIAGTAALQKVNESCFELAKMAVDEKFQGRKLGNLLLGHCIDTAKKLGAEKLMLFSNKKLLPALHLYSKHGFREVPLADSIYSRSDIKMEMYFT